MLAANITVDFALLMSKALTKYDCTLIRSSLKPDNTRKLIFCLNRQNLNIAAMALAKILSSATVLTKS